MITVAQLIEKLKEFDPSLLVAYRKYSDWALLDLNDLIIEAGQPPREGDGYISLPRPDKPQQQYLMFPGN